MTLRLADGTTIVDLSRPRQGIRHRVLLGIEESSGREVALKIELIPGALERERRALEWLTRHGGPAPRLRAAGTMSAGGEYPGAACLVVDRVAGEPATSLSGWEALGRALARLSQVPWRGSDLTRFDHDELLALHERRVADLDRALRRDLGATLPPPHPTHPDSPLVVAHGDPGPGNFLDDGADGTLIDWEDAQVAPQGIDLGRAMFIALLGSGPEGYVGRDHAARADAVAKAFATASARSPGPAALNWWLTVAGVQFAHRRLEHAGEPGALPWLDAVDVLESVAANAPRNDP